MSAHDLGRSELLEVAVALIEDLDAIFDVLDRWVERLNPPELVVKTTDRRWR